MAQEPDRLRRDIEDTRAELTRDVDRLAEKTSPKRVAQRRWTAVKEKVMGSADTGRYATSRLGDKASDLGDRVGDKASALGDRAGAAAHGAADAVRSAPQAVARQTEGNPLAAGIIAFGVGMLAATLIPTTEAEKRAGQQLKENMGDLAEQAKETARELKDDVAGTVSEGVQQVKETAQDAARTTRDDAKSSAQGAVEQTREAARQP
jgi:hypothetical protein